MKLYLLAFILLSGFPILCAAGDSTLFLIPQPKQVELWDGTFNFSRSFFVSAGPAQKFCAQQLKQAIATKFLQKPVDSLSATNRIRLVKADSAALTRIIGAEKLTAPFGLGSEGYVLAVSPKTILIAGTDDAGLFYGVQTLIQLINANSNGATIPCMVIYDKPDMQMRGWQDDISRGPIPTMGFLKEEIRRMSSYKLNTFTLYTEHVFKLKKHPEIAPADGITEEGIRELTRFAKDYYVDIIGNFQSFGHFKNILKTPGYESLAEDEHTISPAKEESYKFLGDVYSEVAPAYSSKYFHINCDEVTLGNGPCKPMIDSMGIGGVYAYHINRVDALLKPYRKKIMMWGDIAVHNPKIIDRLPSDMIIVSWGYSEMPSFDADILPFVQSGFQFIVAPGVSCWTRIYPDLTRTTTNIYNYLRDGYKNHALGFINTTWDDDGQNLFNNNWYGLTWGADCGWNAPPNEPVKQSDETRKKRLTAFNRCYNHIYFETDKEMVALMQAVSDLRTGPVKNCLSTGSIWSDLLPDNNAVPANYERDNLNLKSSIDTIYTIVSRCKPWFPNRSLDFDLMLFAMRQAKLVANKNLLGIKLKEYLKTDQQADVSRYEKDFSALIDTVKELKTEYGRLWKLENRNWWLDTVYSYYENFPQNLRDLKGACIIKGSDKLVDGKRQFTLRSAFNNLPVYYTTDPKARAEGFIKYTQPLLIDTAVKISARVIDGSRMYDIASDSFVLHKGIGNIHKLNCKWTAETIANATNAGPALVDGRRGSKNTFNDGRWQGFFGTDINVELDFDSVTSLNKVTVSMGQLMRYGGLYPKMIEVQSSDDGVNYTRVNFAMNALELNTEVRSTHDYVIPLNNTRARYLKVIVTGQGPLPSWHYSRGTNSWLYCDEIMVE